MDPRTNEGPGRGDGTAGARPGRMGRARKALLGVHPSTVFCLVALSLGLGAVAAQMYYLPLLVVFAMVWGVTVIAMMGITARWIEESRHHHHAPPRAAVGL
ncbi:hypothetical protein [Kitasatospora sp. NBC_00315]|uniref:hypothetical protein n=1 Tax=Kitasatospora sp. NBC_00315 TaxID=2975963 RepID=UPI0032511968